jgi:hypothetical protein
MSHDWLPAGRFAIWSVQHGACVLKTTLTAVPSDGSPGPNTIKPCSPYGNFSSSGFFHSMVTPPRAVVTLVRMGDGRLGGRGAVAGAVVLGVVVAWTGAAVAVSGGVVVVGAATTCPGIGRTVGVGFGAAMTCPGTAAIVGVGGAVTSPTGILPVARAGAPPVVSRESVDKGDGGGGAEPPRTKCHEHVPVEAVAGGAPGKFGAIADGPEPLMVGCVAAPSIAGNGHSSTYGIAVPVVVPVLRNCGAPPMRTVPSAVSRIVIVSGIGWPPVVHCSVTAD